MGIEEISEIRLNQIPYQVHSQSNNFMPVGKEKKKLTGDFLLITCTKL